MNREGNKENRNRRQFQEKVFRMVSVGIVDVRINQFYDVFSTAMLLVNLAATIMNTFDSLNAQYGALFALIEHVTVAFFAVDYVLRLISAPCLYPDETEGAAVRKYMLSFAGVVDLLSFLPFYLPFFFPAGTAAFRMFRVVRIMRLFRINAYYDSLNVISEVIISKKQQLLSSVFIILVLMVASSLCMYSLEHEAQPDVFQNAFSGIWWSASTLLTVGYGDIYAITTLGRVFSIFITFLGVGMVAIPTGIISAGFVEHYQRLERIGAERQPEDEGVGLREVTLKKDHPWNGTAIRDLDISRQAYIVLVRRRNLSLMPDPDLILSEGDMVFLCPKEKTSEDADRQQEI